MARLPRLYAPEVPQLVQTQFTRPLGPGAASASTAEFNTVLTWLQRSAREYQLPVHGWVLLHDRLAFLATPPQADSIAKVIQQFGRYFATRLAHGRVFAGRYRSALLEPGNWVAPALVWLDSLPVRMACVDSAEQWPWSSAATHTGVGSALENWTIEHADYWHYGNTPFARQANYRIHLDKGLSALQIQKIDHVLFGQWALGDAEFLARLSERATRRAIPAPKGRPKKPIPARPPAGNDNTNIGC